MILQNPSLQASGLILTGEPGVTEYSNKLTGSAVYCINFEDQYLTGGVRTTATLARSDGWEPVPSGNMIGRKSIVLHNHGSNTAYVTGTSGMAVTTAFPLLAGGNISFDLLSYQQLYVRTLVSVSDIRVMESV